MKQDLQRIQLKWLEHLSTKESSNTQPRTDQENQIDCEETKIARRFKQEREKNHQLGEQQPFRVIVPAKNPWNKNPKEESIVMGKNLDPMFSNDAQAKTLSLWPRFDIQNDHSFESSAKDQQPVYTRTNQGKMFSRSYLSTIHVRKLTDGILPVTKMKKSRNSKFRLLGRKKGILPTIQEED